MATPAPKPAKGKKAKGAMQEKNTEKMIAQLKSDLADEVEAGATLADLRKGKQQWQNRKGDPQVKDAMIAAYNDQIEELENAGEDSAPAEKPKREVRARKDGAERVVAARDFLLRNRKNRETGYTTHVYDTQHKDNDKFKNAPKRYAVVVLETGATEFFDKESQARNAARHPGEWDSKSKERMSGYAAEVEAERARKAKERYEKEKAKAKADKKDKPEKSKPAPRGKAANKSKPADSDSGVHVAKPVKDEPASDDEPKFDESLDDDEDEWEDDDEGEEYNDDNNDEDEDERGEFHGEEGEF